MSREVEIAEAACSGVPWLGWTNNIRKITINKISYARTGFFEFRNFNKIEPVFSTVHFSLLWTTATETSENWTEWFAVDVYGYAYSRCCRCVLKWFWMALVWTPVTNSSMVWEMDWSQFVLPNTPSVLLRAPNFYDFLRKLRKKIRSAAFVRRSWNCGSSVLWGSGGWFKK